MVNIDSDCKIYMHGEDGYLEIGEGQCVLRFTRDGVFEISGKKIYAVHDNVLSDTRITIVPSGVDITQDALMEVLDG